MLIKVSIFSKPRLKISFVTQLCDDIAVAVAGKNLEAFEHIGMI